MKEEWRGWSNEQLEDFTAKDWGEPSSEKSQN